MFQDFQKSSLATLLVLLNQHWTFHS